MGNWKARTVRAPACAQTKAAEPAPLTSIAIDPTLFREGAITRLAGTRGAWSYDCDEVARLKQRFCSLRTSVKAADGAILAGLTSRPDRTAGQRRCL